MYLCGIVSDMAKIHFLLKDPQHSIEEASKKQDTLILFVYRISGLQKVVYSIKEHINPNFWDFAQQRPKSIRNRADLAELKIKLSDIDAPFSYSITVGASKVEYVKPKYECISAHTARRSFATNIHKAGIPPAVAMVFTGHKTMQQYMNYIMVFEEETAVEYENHPFFMSNNGK